MEREVRRPALAVLILLSAFLALAPAARASEPAVFDPAAWQREIESSKLDPARAVSLKGVELKAGLATLSLEEGVLVPATPVAGRSAEMVFLGKGKILLNPPDDIEKGQLELFTGGNRLEEPFTEMVLALGLDGAVDALLRKAKATPDATQTQRAAELYTRWRGRPERKLLDVDGAILADASGDSSAQGFVAAWLKGAELGDFLYVVDPESNEQVTLGSFVPLDATEKEKRKILKQIDRQQRQGRLIGVELEDLGQWDTWLSASLRGKEDKVITGLASFEPQKYTLDVSLDNDLKMTGKARLDLAPTIQGARVVDLSLYSDLVVNQVTDSAGADLFFHRTGGGLQVFLPKAPGPQDTVTLNVEYQGAAIHKDGNTYLLRDTEGWYPHAGTVDRAPYDVTLHWPRKIDLVAPGKRVDGGEDAGRLWERRTFDIPAAWFTFEVGRYKIETAQAGHVKVNLAFDPEAKQLLKKEREEIRQTVVDSLAYFEELFGPYPLDEITVVTTPRDFSQSSFGFVTLSSVMMIDPGVWNVLFQMEDRRTVIAHEISHQWWGHAVGWASYRDQWISEAMANYSSLLFGRKKLDWKDRYGLGPTAGWQDALTNVTADGRPIESLGPVVLGTRLFSSHSSSDAYEAIVYRKGAVILDMLARGIGEDNFPKVLKQIVKVTANRPISTDRFLDLMERITTVQLDSFAGQFVYGTGLPEVYYTYSVQPKDGGKWTIQGEARQQTPYRFRYRVVKNGETFDVQREKLDQIQVQGSTLIVPFQADIYDPGRERKKNEASNAILRGTMILAGEKTPFSVDIDYKPSRFTLDRDQAVFGIFYNESEQPKRMLYYRGLDAAAAGKVAEAEALYKQALAAQVEVSTSTEKASFDERNDLKRNGRVLDARAELGLARLYLEQGKDAQAQEAFDKAEKVLAKYEGWVGEELKLVQSRLEMRRGAYDKAFRRLRKGVLGGGDLDSPEAYVLLAIAAQATGNQKEMEEALKSARDNGADVAALVGG